MKINTMKKVTLLFGLLAITLGMGSWIGMHFNPGSGGWYAALIRPFFAPPNWIFAPVWTLLYTLITVAGWRIYCLHNFQKKQRAFWCFYATQWLFNWAWSVVFFGFHAIGFALFNLIIICFLVAGTTWTAKKIDRLSGYLLVPYLAWVLFALLLNAAYFYLN